MRESAVAWSWFDVEVARHLPEKQHPDVRCRCCRELLRNAQLGRTVLPHAAYKCSSATTSMVDTARRLMYESNVRKADAGSRVARAQLAMGEGGEPNYIQRHMRDPEYSWLPGHGGGPSDEEQENEEDEDEEEKAAPPPAKKQRVSKATPKPKAKTAKKTKEKKPTKPTTVATAAAQLEVEFSAQAFDENSGASFMLAEAFHSLGVPLDTLDNPIFRSILKILNPNVTLPPRAELQQVLLPGASDVA